jgi:hypothetical protein
MTDRQKKTEMPRKPTRASVLWAVVSCTHAINDLDRDFYWIHDRWTYSRALGWRHAVLFRSAAQWCRRFCGIVVRVANVKMRRLKAKG